MTPPVVVDLDGSFRYPEAAAPVRFEHERINWLTRVRETVHGFACPQPALCNPAVSADYLVVLHGDGAQMAASVLLLDDDPTELGQLRRNARFGEFVFTGAQDGWLSTGVGLPAWRGQVADLWDQLATGPKHDEADEYLTAAALAGLALRLGNDPHGPALQLLTALRDPALAANVTVLTTASTEAHTTQGGGVTDRGRMPIGAA